MPIILTIPGLGGSGPQHWQSVWEAQHRRSLRRVEQQDWDHPQRADWVAQVEHSVQQAGPGVVLVAHSLACATVAHWAATPGTAAKLVAGALLVAPADVDQADFPPEAVGFAPMPLARLPFPSIVVASANDEYVTLARSQQFAQAWGSRFVPVGAQGHLNSESELGDWPAGWSLVQEMVPQAPAFS